jgi:hypothetical protein
MPTKCRGVTRRAWLAKQTFDFAAQQHAFDDYLGALDLVDRRIEALEREVRQTAERDPWPNSSPSCAACAGSTP